MKIWQITAPGSVSIYEGKESAGTGSLKVKLERAAVSSLDIDFFTGAEPVSFPFVPARLGMGIVSENPDGDGAAQRGNRVVIEPYICGGDGTSLTMGKNADGLLRDFVCVPTENVHLLPDHVSDDEAVLSDLVAIALNALDKLRLEKGQHIAIIGASAIGIIMAELAIYYQAVPILIDARQDMLDIAEGSGVYYTINTAEVDAFKKITEITGGRLCEAAAYISTASDRAQKSIDFSGPSGRVVFVGAGNIQNSITVSLQSVASKNLTITGVNSGRGFTARAINMLANKAVDVAPLITRTVTFDQIPEVMKQLAENPLINIIINVVI